MLFIGSIFFHPDETVTIQPSVPPTVKPGEEFTVELTVSKGNISGFAELQQYLPEGFTAVPAETRNSSFVFEEHHVRFTWKELPSEPSFRISYKIRTDATCNGMKTLNGEFSYIENDLPKKITLTPSVIVLSNELMVSSDTSAEDANKEIVVRKFLFTSKTKRGSYRVDLKINKGSRIAATRIFDKVIDGYGAEIIDSKGARFSYANRLAEFYWETLPKDSVFTISYFMVPDSTMSADYSITSLLKQNNVQENPAASSTEASVSAPLSSAQESSISTAPSSSNSPLNSTLTANPVSPKVKIAASKANRPQPSVQASVSPKLTGIPSPQKGIYYKIQIAATKHSPDRTSEYFRLKYNISEPVEITMHEGWKKYMVGVYEKYASAKQKNTETKSKIPDAFVVAYNDDFRIPLREALKPKNRNQ
jgi:hypothetical protein